MSDEPRKRRPRRRPRRRPKKGAQQGDKQAAAAEGGGAKRPRGGRGRSRAKKRTKAKTRRPRRGRSSRNWWTKRWSESVEGIRVGRRLGRGRSYARQGRVVELEFEKGSVTALVQGSRDAPYRVRMHFSVLTVLDWKRVLDAMGEDVEIGGGLFRGEFPERSDEIFAGLDLSLFPSGQGDLKAACSCPDEANPCKHVAAVYYALGEEIDRDPFQLLRLRGLHRTELMEALARTPAAKAAMVPPPSAEAIARGGEGPGHRDHADDLEEETEVGPEEEPLPEDPQLFWGGLGRDHSGEVDTVVRIPTASGALARRLGGYSFWQGEGTCSGVLDRTYREASSAGLALYLGEAPRENPDED